SLRRLEQVTRKARPLALLRAGSMRAASSPIIAIEQISSRSEKALDLKCEARWFIATNSYSISDAVARARFSYSPMGRLFADYGPPNARSSRKKREVRALPLNRRLDVLNPRAMKFAICNEIFRDWKLEDALSYAARTG